MSQSWICGFGNECRLEDNNEATVNMAWSLAFNGYLPLLLGALPAAKGAVWRPQARLLLVLHEKVLAELSGDGTPQPAPRDPSPQQESASRLYVADFALSVDVPEPPPATSGGRQAAADAQPSLEGATRKRYLCIVKFKALCKLTTAAGAPVDLLTAYANVLDRNHASAQHVIAQVYTYLQVTGCCYGIISCYLGTWLAFCPPDNRGALFISHVFLSSTCCDLAATPRVPSAMGAVVWVQYVALEQRDAVPPAAPRPQGEPPGGEGSGGGGGGGGGGGRHVEDEGDDVSRQGDTTQESAGCGSQGPGTASEASKQHKHQGQHGEEPPAGSLVDQPHGMLVLHSKLCVGSAGLVVLGAYGGEPAVVKLLGPDDEGLTAYSRESSAYDAVQGLQGTVVPKLLAAGHANHGVYYIAVSRLPGQPLSEVAQPFPPGVVKAAEDALRQLHAACPGFLHGDIRLENMILLPPGSPGGDCAKCMVIDFGRARLGRAQEQDMEVRQLRRLLGK
ncbi:hypothetical protein TSOC_007543 [Tetrabaena socialis]|uniref:Protein kinase domain-containing protein n=1 Tax=Tetrabaena socialis TaxID=47790 RepID=A0A2J8A0S6_9CHLO|nr:hypothetical protein TSOC_007543 [Tetrabaena socialis]|eukprot:PNH06131.1 hypothetical protein TSOC_007543 [Tetrabaena socialis]